MFCLHMRISISPVVCYILAILSGLITSCASQEVHGSFLQYALFLLVFLHPTVTLSVLELFKCESVLGAGLDYLVSDVSVRCRSPSWCVSSSCTSENCPCIGLVRKCVRVFADFFVWSIVYFF